MVPQQQKRWFALYRAALLESDLRQMPGRIVLAGQALQNRLRALQETSGHYGERVDIEYAISNLRVAERMSDYAYWQCWRPSGNFDLLGLLVRNPHSTQKPS